MELIKKEDLPQVAYDGMNRVHDRELEILNRLYGALVKDAPEEEITELLKEFIDDVKEHFAYEEDLMRKTHFFAYECHSGEHKRVLEELAQVEKEWLEKRDKKALRRYFERTFRPWIADHILTMDTVTAQWLSRVLLGTLP